MLVYLLKSASCLAILYFFYLLFLEKERMHFFKRFYLLSSLALSLIIPLVTFTEYVNLPANLSLTTALLTNDAVVSQELAPKDPDTLNLSLVMGLTYLLGVVFFAWRFLQNLTRIINRIRTNEKLKQPSSIKVLLMEKVTPHTFLHYIFLNKTAFITGKIPSEVLLHEETHVRQKHSLDVIFVGLFQVALWFNPFVYLINKAIKLNHEFLADSAVLNKGIHSVTYQNTLLSYSSKKHQPDLANAINYSSIKKRFTVMKSQTSKKILWIKSLLFLPLTVLLLAGFSNTEIEYREVEASPASEASLESTQIKIEIKEDFSLWLNNREVALPELSQKIVQLVSPELIGNQITITTSEEINLPTDLINQLQTELSEIGISSIKFNSNEVHINEFPTSREPVILSHEEGEPGISSEQLAQYEVLFSKYQSASEERPKIAAADLETMELLYELMSPTQRAHVHPYQELPYQVQEEVTVEMIEEYNRLARKYNAMPRDRFVVIGSEVDRLRYIYNLMSQDQRANAEAFPEFPEPPTPPEPPTSISDPVVAEELQAVPEVEVKESVDVKTEVDLSPGVDVQPDIDVRPETAVKPRMAVKPRVAPSPTPAPAPKSPLKLLDEMAENNAIFYYEGEEISYSKARKIYKKAKRLSVRVEHEGLDRPVVTMSKSPLKITSD